MGVLFARPDKNDKILGIARNSERGLGDDEAADEDPDAAETSAPETTEESTDE